jgi:5-methylcytosine-specific restriction endonuclease McrA
MKTSTLVLNRSYYAVQIADFKDVMSKLYTGEAQALDADLRTYDFKDWVDLSSLMEVHDHGFINTVSLRIAIPEVIRLTRYDRLPRQDVKFTRSNILEHYRHLCAYCGIQVRKEWNLDHVVPRSKGGTTDWTNIVLSCIPCNTRKADKTPAEAGMNLRVHPSRPKWKGVRTVTVNAPLPMPKSWQALIDRAYYESELSFA